MDESPETRDAIDAFADVAWSLAEQETLDATLQRIVDMAVDAVPGVILIGRSGLVRE